MTRLPRIALGAFLCLIASAQVTDTAPDGTAMADNAPPSWPPKSFSLDVDMPIVMEGAPPLTVTGNGSAVVIPDEYWRSVLNYDPKATPELAKALEEAIPFNDQTAAYFDYLNEIQVIPFYFNGSRLAPNINGMLRSLYWREFASGAGNVRWCICSSTSDCNPSRSAYYHVEPGPQWQPGLLAQFNAVVNILGNATLVAKYEKIPMSFNSTLQEDQLLAKAAGFPVATAQTVRGLLTRMQYAFYQFLVHGDSRKCSLIPVVECGTHGADRCDTYLLKGPPPGDLQYGSDD